MYRIVWPATFVLFSFALPVIFFMGVPYANAEIDFLFERVARSGVTSVPDKQGTFTGVGELSLDDDVVAFTGTGSDHEAGIYVFSGGTIHKVVDNNTPVPNSDATFFPTGISLDGENVAFWTHGYGPLSGSNQGVHAQIGGTLQVVADGSTLAPNGQDTFSAFGGASVSIDGSDVVFEASADPTTSTNGVFARIDGTMVHVVDTTDPVPGASNNFWHGFDDLNIEQGDIVFNGRENITLNTGIYKSSGGTLSVVADENTEVPNGGGETFSRVDRPVLDNGRVSFVGYYGLDTVGMFVSDNGQINKLFDTTGTVTQIGAHSFDGDNVAFLGRDSSDRQAVFLYANGELQKVIGETDVIDGREISFFNFEREGLSGNSLGFTVRFKSDNSSGSYTATYDPACNVKEDFRCDVADIDELYSVFETSVPPTHEKFDLNSDSVIDNGDLDEWLSDAAMENHLTVPYRRGDTELDGDVDVTDFNSVATNFDPTGQQLDNSWLFGNFDGDGDTDITDFNLLASNFAPSGYATSAIPEPSSVLLLLLGLGCVMLLCCSRAWRWGP